MLAIGIIVAGELVEGAHGGDDGDLPGLAERRNAGAQQHGAAMTSRRMRICDIDGNASSKR